MWCLWKFYFSFFFFFFFFFFHTIFKRKIFRFLELFFFLLHWFPRLSATAKGITCTVKQSVVTWLVHQIQRTQNFFYTTLPPFPHHLPSPSNVFDFEHEFLATMCSLCRPTASQLLNADQNRVIHKMILSSFMLSIRVHDGDENCYVFF
jgi:hypothetical protein